MNNIRILEENINKHLSTFEKLKNKHSFKKKLDYSINLLKNSIKKGGKIIFIGNGGSAADAQHLSAELVGKFLRKENHCHL